MFLNAQRTCRKGLLLLPCECPGAPKPPPSQSVRLAGPVRAEAPGACLERLRIHCGAGQVLRAVGAGGFQKLWLVASVEDWPHGWQFRAPATMAFAIACDCQL